jgi:hypothetical protein
MERDWNEKIKNLILSSLNKKSFRTASRKLEYPLTRTIT